MIIINYYDDPGVEMEKLSVVNEEGIEKTIFFGNYWDNHGEDAVANITEVLQLLGIPFEYNEIQWNSEE